MNRRHHQSGSSKNHSSNHHHGGGSPGATTVVGGGAVEEPPAANLESMRRLQALKDKIDKEWQREKQERQEAKEKDPIVPISLVNIEGKDGAGGGAGDGSSPMASKYVRKYQKKAQERAQFLSKDAKEKIAALKLPEKWMNRELESELEAKSAKMTELRQKNAMYRDIITLRQESNARREVAVEKEIEKLKGITDSVCVRAANMDETMAELRRMNKDIQEGTAQLKDTMERQAEADLMGLISTYRVRMREVKQHIEEQEDTNYKGAKAWIDRHDILRSDRDTAKTVLEALMENNQMLVTQNEELKVMTKHQSEQRNTLTAKIAVVKRENKRLEEQVNRLEGQVVDRLRNNSAVSGAAGGSGMKHVRAQQLNNSRANTAPAHASRMDSSNSGVGGGVSTLFVDKRQTQALAKVRKQLEAMRRQLREVRTNHVELLQERTELEVFMRQCIEDVRRDMYRFTVVSTIPRTISGDRIQEEKAVLQEYGAKEKKVLINILNSKLKVLSLLHIKTFPQKTITSTDILGDFINNTEQGSQNQNPQDPNLPSTAVNANAVTSDEAAELDMDKLWAKWKQWSGSMHGGSSGGGGGGAGYQTVAPPPANASSSSSFQNSGGGRAASGPRGGAGYSGGLDRRPNSVL